MPLSDLTALGEPYRARISVKNHLASAEEDLVGSAEILTYLLYGSTARTVYH